MVGPRTPTPSGTFISTYGWRAYRRRGPYMAWFALARVMFVAVVAYAAGVIEPLPVGLVANVAFALALAALVVGFELCLRRTAMSRVFGALIGCGVGLAIAHAI